MNTSKYLPTRSRCRASLLALGFSLLLSGCASASSSEGKATALAPAAASSRGGVTYDATAPLEAKLSPKFDAANPPAESLTYGLRYQGGNGQTVPALLTVPAKSTGKLPAVILLHGLGGKKEDVALVAMALARKGYATLAIDIAGHGERPPINGKAVSDLDVKEFRTLIGQTVVDLRRGVDYLVSRPDVDPKRIGYVGVSLGGIIGGVFAGDEPRLKAVSLWAAGGDLGKIFLESSHPYVQKYRNRADGKQATVAEIDAVLNDVDPLPALKRAPARPMLFLYGDADTIVPTATESALYEAAKEPKKRQVFKGGHIPDIFGMINVTMTWLDDNVKK